MYRYNIHWSIRIYHIYITQPMFLGLSTYIVKIISSETRQERYDGCLSVDLNEKVTNLQGETHSRRLVF